MSKLSVSRPDLDSWKSLLEMFSDKESLLQGAAGEDAMSVGDVLEIVNFAKELERELAEEVALHQQTQRLLAEGLAENISLKRSMQSLEDHDFYQRGVDGR